MGSLKVVVVARLSRDVDKVTGQLREMGFHTSVVPIRTLDELAAELKKPALPDMVVVYHPLPSFRSVEAVELVEQLSPNVPCVAVSKTDAAARELEQKSAHYPAMVHVPEADLSRFSEVVPRLQDRSLPEPNEFASLGAAVLPAAGGRGASSNREAAIFDAMLEMVVLLDTNLKIQWLNKAACDAAGMDREELIGRPCFEVWRGQENHCSGCPVQRTLDDHQPHEREMFLPEGKVLHVRSSPVLGVDGRLEGVVETALDISEQLASEEELRLSAERLRRAMEGTIETLALTIELRDPHTAGHQRRVAVLAGEIARETGFAEDQVYGLRLAASIHDVGKIYVPSEILSKPRRLTAIEFDLIKTHPVVGHALLKNIEFPWPVARVILQHHERMDGSGYPNGISGPEILPGARILAVADVVEAVASHRPYRPALGIKEALSEITANSGKLYDPHAVDACLRLFERGFRFDEEDSVGRVSEEDG